MCTSLGLQMYFLAELLLHRIDRLPEAMVDLAFLASTKTTWRQHLLCRSLRCMRMLDSPWECWIHHEHARFAMIPLVLSWECLFPHENACVTATARCCSTANLPHWLMASPVFYQSIAPTSLGECQPGWRAVERSGKEWTQEAGWVSFLMPGQPQRQAAMDWAVKLTTPATDWVV